ncbi:selenoprotein YdfZ, partial [Salmonella enterica subsp. enterica serovar Panama]
MLSPRFIEEETMKTYDRNRNAIATGS